MSDKESTLLSTSPSSTVKEHSSGKPQILLLSISRYRGIHNLDWRPHPDFNIIIGGGDAGKTTVLDAISLLFSPSNSVVVSESDYWLNDTENEFSVEAVVYIPDSMEIANQSKFNWPWEWNGENASVCPIDQLDDDIDLEFPVYKFRVRGTSDLELLWEIIQPDESTNHLSVGIRREIGVVKLSAEDSNDKDLRLVYGSALDTLVGDNGLRARIAQKVSDIDVHGQLSEGGQRGLKGLDDALKEEALPNDLKLGLTTSKGISIGSLIGLLADRRGVSLPLSSWGAGTRRMSTLEVSYCSQNSSSLVVIDEIERGLEPYRQRKLLAKLQSDLAQTFITTHSPFVINALATGGLWYLGFDGILGELERKKVSPQLSRDPEAFLAKSVVIAEGDTEAGFLGYFLERAFKSDPLDFGVRITSAGGNDYALDLLEAMAEAGLTFSGLADYEGRNRGRWDSLKSQLGDHLLQWKEGCLEENVIAQYPQENLKSLCLDRDGDFDGDRLRTLATRLDISDKSFANICEHTEDLRRLIIEAATGNSGGVEDKSEKKAWKKHAQNWFKSVDGGRELAEKTVADEVIGQLEPKLLPLINAILASVGVQRVRHLS